MFHGVPARQFLGDLWRESSDDNLFNGAAALAYYAMLAIFPALIFLLSLLPFVPVPHLRKAIVDFLAQLMPPGATAMIGETLERLARNSRGGLLSFGLVFTLWSASSGLQAVMRQLNIAYDVKETRSFLKARGIALLLTGLFFVLVVGGFALVVFGGVMQAWVASVLGWSRPLLVTFAVFRWIVIAAMFLLGFAAIYYFGPDVEQTFRFVTTGSVVGVVLLAAASLGFRIYVDNFSSYDRAYGSIGAIMILMLWFYLAGLVILLGSEVNALVEHYNPAGKEKGDRRQPAGSRRAA